LVFDTASAVTPLASDLLLVAPHLAAIALAWERRPLACGIALGIGFAASPKALFVAAVCLLWNPGGIWGVAAGMAAGGAVVAGGWLGLAGALPAFWDEVWRWGRLYAANNFVAEPIRNGLLRSAGWAGFHLALLIPAARLLQHRDRDAGPSRMQWILWLGLSL